MIYNDYITNDPARNDPDAKKFTGVSTYSKITLAQVGKDTVSKQDLEQPESDEKNKKYLIVPESFVQVGPNQYAMLADKVGTMGASTFGKVLFLDF